VLRRPVLTSFLVALLLEALPARADSWAGPVTKEVFSASREYFVRVVPGKSVGDTFGFAGEKKGPYARAEFFRRLSKHPRRTCPFVNLPNATGRSHWGEGITGEDMAKLRWVRPDTVVEVSFVEWTRDGLLRHPAYVGVREDIDPTAVRRE